LRNSYDFGGEKVGYREPQFYLVPLRKGKVGATIICTLDSEEREVAIGELAVRLPSIADFPEFGGKVIMDPRNIWVMLPSGEYRRAPEHSALGWFIDKVFRFFEQGRSGVWYTDDELVHRTCLLWLDGKTKNKAFLRKVAELLLAGKREEVRALLIAKEL
jgi:hypothetical protein